MIIRMAVVTSVLVGGAVAVHSYQRRAAPPPAPVRTEAKAGEVRPGRPEIPVAEPVGAGTSVPREAPVETVPGRPRVSMDALRNGTWDEKQKAVSGLFESAEGAELREGIEILMQSQEMFLKLQAMDLMVRRQLKDQLPRLLDLLAGGGIPILREHAAAAVGALGDDQTAASLHKVYAQGDVQGQRLAAQALDRLGQGAPLQDFLQRTSASLRDLRPERLGWRLTMLSELSRVAAPGVGPVMTQALGDPEPTLRLQAVHWFGEHGRAEDLATLGYLQQETDPLVRAALDEATAKIRARR